MNTSATEPQPASSTGVDDLAAAVGRGSLAVLLAWRDAEAPEHPFLFIEDQSAWTFGELTAAAARLADGFGARCGRVSGNCGGSSHAVFPNVSNER